jgi:hypothetical protein
MNEHLPPSADYDAACLCGLVVTGGCPTHPHGRPDLDGARNAPSWPPRVAGQAYVADREGVVWLLVPEYDGGMATTATATGQWSVGINTLTSERAPLVRVFPPGGTTNLDPPIPPWCVEHQAYNCPHTRGERPRVTPPGDFDA